MPGSIRIEAEYPHAPERVWAALTNPDAIKEWLMPNDFSHASGMRFGSAWTTRGAGAASSIAG